MLWMRKKVTAVVVMTYIVRRNGRNCTVNFNREQRRVGTCHVCLELTFISIYTLSREKAMATHSSTLAWKTPWMEEPCRLQSMESLGVGHYWATSLWLFTFMHWRRKWQPTPVFLPGESQGPGILVGCCPWGNTESVTTEVTWHTLSPLSLIKFFDFYVL